MKFIKSHFYFILFILIGLVITVVTASYFVIEKEQEHVFTMADTELHQLSDSINVGIVFGGGINPNSPRPVLRERLDTAIALLNEDKIEKVILSGDNRFEDYNEPEVMFNYMIENGIPENQLQQDFAGRSTYETCERANKIFNVRRAFLISQETHLERAVYLCRHFSIESYGVSTQGVASERSRSSQSMREIFARVKAVFNVYLLGENTVLGEQIDLNL